MRVNGLVAAARRFRIIAQQRLHLLNLASTDGVLAQTPRSPESPGIQWPVTDQTPNGTERLYTDAIFPTAPNICETYTSDLMTGAPRTATEYLAMNPRGRPGSGADHHGLPSPL